MPILSAQNLTMSFLDRTLFSDACFEIEPNDRVGLIGANGTGKTTLFKIITGQMEATDGGVFMSKNITVGCVDQHACSDADVSAYEEILKVFAPVIEIENRLEAIAAEIDSSHGERRDALIAEQAMLTDEFQLRDGLSYRARARSALLGLGFTPAETELPVAVLSGGQKTKISLGKLLLSGANLILLDEPTNHLDLKSVEWLEDYLKKYSGAAVIISHDRFFLDKVTNKTVEIEHRRVTMTKGGYSLFMRLKAERIEAQRREYENTVKEIKRIEGIIEQQRTFSMERNFITIASKQKQIDRLKQGLVAPDPTLREMKLHFPVLIPGGNDVLSADGVSKSFGEKKLFENVSFELHRGEKLFFIGPNGCGKTTLLKIIMRMLSADSGQIRFGQSVKPGYYDQTQKGLDSPKTVLDEVSDALPHKTPGELRSYLAAFLFRGEDVFKRMSELSGGERAKVSLLEIMLKGANLLVLDEPTNHLDIASREALEAALEEYEGTLLCVSHDRYFINRLADKLLVFLPDGVKRIEGNYDTYCSVVDNLPVNPTGQKDKKPDEYRLRKERESNERKRLARIKRLEDEIAQLDKQKEETQSLIISPEVASDYEKIIELTRTLETLGEMQEQKYTQWLELNEDIEETENGAV